MLPDIDWMGLALPFTYLTVLIGSLMVFSTIYRKRKAAQAANLAPWFGPHLQRNIYMTLLHMEPGEKQPKVPDSVLRAALLRRAVEDINRIVQIRSAKQACSTLLQRGCVGDDLWQRFQRAEKEMEEELRDVVMEANALGNNWGQFIFQSANEIHNNMLLRERLDEIQAQADSEKTWWDAKRATMEKDLLDADTASTSGAGDGAKTPAKSVTSDEDTVVVGTPATTINSTPASQKKKKGKK